MRASSRTRGRRLVRGLVVAGFATFVASIAHTTGGGQAPGILAVVLSLAFSLPLAVLLAGRVRPWRTVVSALIAQALLHALYSLGEGGAIAAPVVAGHVHDPLAGLAGLGAGVAGHPEHAAMLLAHLGAAALTILALLRGDAALDAIARALRTVVARLLGPVAVAPVAARGIRLPAPRPRSSHALETVLSALHHRGPPAATLAH